jgi:hexosaminidase
LFKAALNATTRFGAFRGLETLAQLITYDFDKGGYVISGLIPVAIDDAPRFPHRVVLIDTARHFLSKRVLFHARYTITYSVILAPRQSQMGSGCLPFCPSIWLQTTEAAAAGV